MATCRQSSWNILRGQTALGATRYEGSRTIQQCLDYCNATASCVAVDIDVNVVPLRCWAHFNRDDLRPDNIYTQPGTDCYQLVKRCPNARQGSIFLTLQKVWTPHVTAIINGQLLSVTAFIAVPDCVINKCPQVTKWARLRHCLFLKYIIMIIIMMVMVANYYRGFAVRLAVNACALNALCLLDNSWNSVALRPAYNRPVHRLLELLPKNGSHSAFRVSGCFDSLQKILQVTANNEWMIKSKRVKKANLYSALL